MKMKIAFATAMTLAFAVPASAAEPVSAQIRFGDLNLASEKGFAALSRRIDQAAGRICGEEPRGLSDRAAHAECVADVQQQAHAKLRNQLTGAPVQMARR